MTWNTLKDFVPLNTSGSQIGPPMTQGSFQDPTSAWALNISNQILTTTATGTWNNPLLAPSGESEADGRIVVRATGFTKDLYLLLRRSYVFWATETALAVGQNDNPPRQLAAYTFSGGTLGGPFATRPSPPTWSTTV